MYLSLKKPFFYGLAALSLSACDGSGLVYAPVRDLTPPPVSVKSTRVMQHQAQAVPNAHINSLAVSKNASLGQLFVERVQPEKMQLKERSSEAFSEISRHPMAKKGEEKASKPEVVPTPTPEPVQAAPAQKTPIEPEVTPEVTAPVASKSGWSWPTKGRVVSRFVASSISGNKGIEIQGALGQPIWATAAGKVVYSGSGVRGYGNLIIIKHNQSYLSAYAYNQRLLVREGDSVKSGQVIAEMGKAETGRVLLHFEIRYNGQPVDPLTYLK